MRIGLILAAVVLACGAINSVARAAGECRALIISGDPGREPNAAIRFDDWTDRWAALLKKSGYKPQNIHILRSPSLAVVLTPEDNRMATTLATKPPTTRKVAAEELATLANVRSSLSDLLRDSTAEDQVLVVFIGHGYMVRDTISKFCLPGPDLSDVEFGQIMEPIKARQLIVLNFAPLSNSWAKALMKHTEKQDRVIFTEQMGSQSYFCEFVLRVLEKQNGSLLTAFNSACNGTGKDGADAGLFWYYYNCFINAKKNNATTVNGTLNQQLFRKFYPERDFEAAESQPQSPAFDPVEREGWLNRRVLPEVPGLEDDGNGEPSVTIITQTAIDENATKGTKLQNLPYMKEDEDAEPTTRPGPATQGKRTDGDVAARVILGKP